MNHSCAMKAPSKVGPYDEVLKPTFFLAQILCLAPYKLKYGKMELSFVKLIISVVVVLGNIVLTVIYLRSVNANIDTDFGKASTIIFLSTFRDIGSSTVMLVNLCNSYVVTKRMVESMTTIHQTDLELETLNLGGLIQQHNQHLKTQTWVLLIVISFVFNVLGEVISMLVRSTDQILYLLVNLYPRTVISLLNILFYVLLMLVETRFNIINSALVNALDSSTITRLVVLHKNLVKASREINAMFALQILLCTTIKFILLIGDLHTSMYVVFFGLFAKHYKIVLDMVKNCVTYVFELFYLARRASELCNEANRTQRLLVGVKVAVEDEQERDVVIVSALKLMHNKLEISACRLFNIDNALLFSICGAASSYLFIMLQLDIGNYGGATNATNYTKEM